MAAWQSIPYPGNNGTCHFSYQLETAQLPIGVHITTWELHRGTTKELPYGKKNVDDQSPFNRTKLL